MKAFWLLFLLSGCAGIDNSVLSDFEYKPIQAPEYEIATWQKRTNPQNKNVHICKCGFDDKEHCNNCDGCRINEFVLFVEHSTSYKATEDASFNKLAMIVNNQ